jgi:hypothetical protein
MNSLNEIDYKKPIKGYFDNKEKIFVCLFPFYRKVFANNYNWHRNLKLTYTLIETMTWKEVSNKTGFNQLGRVALGVLDLKEPFKSELSEFCKLEKLEYPDYKSDKIPEVVLIPILEYLKKKNHFGLEMKSFARFHLCPTGRIELQDRETFKIFETVKETKFLKTENSICILLPDYDCPYMLLIGKEVACKELIENAHLETFEVDERTTFQWWIV